MKSYRLQIQLIFVAYLNNSQILQLIYNIFEKC